MVRARSMSPPLTLDDAIEIWGRHWLSEAQHITAAAFGVNQGRISEVLSGKRHSGAQAIALRGRIY